MEKTTKKVIKPNPKKKSRYHTKIKVEGSIHQVVKTLSVISKIQ